MVSDHLLLVYKDFFIHPVMVYCEKYLNDIVLYKITDLPLYMLEMLLVWMVIVN